MEKKARDKPIENWSCTYLDSWRAGSFGVIFTGSIE